MSDKIYHRVEDDGGCVHDCPGCRVDEVMSGITAGDLPDVMAPYINATESILRTVMEIDERRVLDGGPEDGGRTIIVALAMALCSLSHCAGRTHAETRELIDAALIDADELVSASEETD